MSVFERARLSLYNKTEAVENLKILCNSKISKYRKKNEEVIIGLLHREYSVDICLPLKAKQQNLSTYR